MSDHDWAYKQLSTGVRAVIDVNTKPLHVEIERLHFRLAEAERLLDQVAANIQWGELPAEPIQGDHVDALCRDIRGFLAACGGESE